MIFDEDNILQCSCIDLSHFNEAEETSLEEKKNGGFPVKSKGKVRLHLVALGRCLNGVDAVIILLVLI